MLRNKSLIPLSRQHQHALALCVRIERASPIAENDLAKWRAEVAQHFEQEIGFHFAAEEQIVFPAARQFAELKAVVEELIAEHTWLRENFARAHSMSGKDLSRFAQRLSRHIRKEERQLFECMQKLISADGLAALGMGLDEVLKDAEQACALPTAANKPQARTNSSPAGAGSE
ncbi:MAG TPA: hemerythrin domain-containing protein [Candidatus Sulfotelmatobacter sp.]|nr:hemerythrin domain-containing protein [Candidatus Sulfotelmatobacter sp.]